MKRVHSDRKDTEEAGVSGGEKLTQSGPGKEEGAHSTWGERRV